MSDKRIDRSTKSIIALRNFLMDVYNKPEFYLSDVVLRRALKSQGGLAKYFNPEFGISPTSINTLKRLCAEIIDGGFKALDELRKGVLERIEEHEHRENASNKRTRAGLAKRVDELEKELLILKQTNYLLSQALHEVISDIKSIANVGDEAAREHRSKEAIRKLLALMSVKHMSYVLEPNASKVIHLVL